MAQPTPTVLVVDDEVAFGQLLAEHLRSCGFKIVQANDGRAALAQIAEHRPDALLIDLHMPGLTGLEVVEQLARDRQLPPTIVMSAFGGYQVALEAIRLGATDFLSKPFRMAEAELKLRLALAKSGKSATARQRPEEPPKQGMFHGMVGTSAAMQTLYRQIERVARFGSTVVIQGESGTGKELIARALHDASPRRDRPFVAVNCAAIPADRRVDLTENCVVRGRVRAGLERLVQFLLPQLDRIDVRDAIGQVEQHLDLLGEATSPNGA